MGIPAPFFNLEAGLCLIREGKGKKDRYVPIGERACRWLEKYLIEVRPSLAGDVDDGTIFFTRRGRPFTIDWLGRLVRVHVEAAGITKPGACHMFRHTMATAMLENDADIRHIQQILGHASLRTTEIYTKVSIRKLKEVHDRCHPVAHLRRGRERLDVEKQDDAGGQTPGTMEAGTKERSE